jgi:hypothetical protein
MRIIMSARVVPEPEERMAAMLKSALRTAWISFNPCYEKSDFESISHLGQVGYLHVARELLKLGIRLPDEFSVEIYGTTRTMQDAKK